MKTIYKIFMVALIVLIPFFTVISSVNIVLRMPDIYMYQFNSGNLSGNLGLDQKSEALGDLISDFMFGKTDSFTQETSDGDEVEMPLSKEEIATMKHFRSILNWSGIALAIITPMVVGMYYWLFRMKRKDILRMVMKGTLPLFIVLVISEIIVFIIPATRAMFYTFFFQIPFPEGGTLEQILTKSFASMCVGSVVVISTILFLLITWLTKKLTKPRRMFGQS